MMRQINGRGATDASTRGDGEVPARELMDDRDPLAIARHACRIASTWALLAFLVAPASAQRAELEKIIQRRVLANGLEVIVVENHGVPLVTVEITVRNGAFTQTPEYAGLAHMYEHMFFKANDQYPSPDRFIDRASELGAVFNATTREEQVNYYLTLPSDSLEEGMRFLAAALLAPKFRQDELERERQVVLGEYDRNESSPFFRLEQGAGQRLWGSEWSRKNVIGDRKVIETVTPEKMRTIQRLYYVPNNAVLIVAGDVNPAQAFGMAERTFSPWRRSTDPFLKAPVPPMPALKRNDAIIVEEAVQSVTVLVQWQGPSVRADEAATFVADVYSDVLNSQQSRFQRKLVDSGLWQGVLVNYYTLDNVGPITVSGQTTPDKLYEALAAMFAELKASIQPGYISSDELEATKANRAVTSAFGRERSSEFAHTIGFWWSVSGLEYYMKYVDEMARRTPADLRSYATRYIIGKPHVVGVMIPAEDRRRIQLTEDAMAKIGGEP